MSKPNCSQCRHFYITWNAKTPNGCRQFGIQAQERPSAVILSAGLGECQGFEEKKKAPKAESLDLNRRDLW